MTLPIDWRRIASACPDGLIVTDESCRIQFVNAAFLALVSKEASEVIGKKCHDVFACNLCGTPGCPLSGVRGAGAPLLFEDREHCKIKWADARLITASPLITEEGRFAGMIEKVSEAVAYRRIRSELIESRERIRKTMGAIIQAMSMTIEKRDPYTAGHQRRTAKLCRAIATELGFAWERIQGLRMAAAIHDLGKIQVPSAILNKPGLMSEHEMAILRMHPRTAFDILKGIRFPWPLAETIYQHHERLDGSGYPRQLKGDRILLEARILAVADVVESMVSFRPYRPAKGLPEAIEEMRRGRGVIYDARVVDACLVLLTEKGFDFTSKTWTQRPPQSQST